MDLKHKALMRRFVRKRDKAWDTLLFNRKYPGVAEEMIRRKDERACRQLELRSKKRLLPLEIAALPLAERNAVLYERERAALARRADLSRRAARQSFLRKKKRRGEAAAQASLDAALGRIALRESAKEALLRRNALRDLHGVSAQAAAAYANASREEDASWIPCGPGRMPPCGGGWTGEHEDRCPEKSAAAGV